MSSHVTAPLTGPPRLGLSAGVPPAREKLPSESTLAARPHPAGTSSLPAPVWAPASPGPSDHRFLREGPWLRTPGRPWSPGPRGQPGASSRRRFHRCAVRPLSALAPALARQTTRGVLGPWVEPGRPSLPVCPARPSGPRCHPPRPVITRQPPRRADAVGLGSLPRTRGHRGRPAAPAWAGSWGVPAGPLCQQQCLRLPGGLRGQPVPCVL